jgi:PhnB protein
MPADDLAGCIRLTVEDATQAVAFYREVFGAIELQRECLLDGQILEAALVVGRHRILVSQWPEEVSAEAGPVLRLEAAEPVAMLRRAVAAGAEIESSAPSASGVVIRDPAGQRWTLVDVG